MAAEFQLGIPGRGLPPKRNPTPLLVSSSVPPFLASEGMNYYYVLHKSGKGLFAYPKGRPRKDGNQAKGGIQLPSSDDIETSILKIRRDKHIPDSSEWIVL